MKTWLLVPILACMAVGCSSSLVSRRDDGAETTEELKRRVLELQRQSTVHELEIERLKSRLEALEKKGASGQQPARRSPEVEPPTRPEDPLETIAPPAIEESDLEAVSLGKPAPTHAASDTLPPAHTAPTTPAEVASPVSAEEQEAYDRGYTLYHQGRYLNAEGELRRFLQSHPESSLADNAQYWIGESRYARKDLEGALAAFRETIERYPEGNKVPDALLKAGQCFEALEDRGAAVETYRTLVERYPTSSAAARAEDRLKSLE
ncbi:MAG: tol-pal system protein YbgF [Acidobacteria bacterium]|nr:tol-pal system protein YbgF [Acidobacteriota bacterium]